jgi:uncharacterized membrane protein YraQ (UPF0718 family)
MNRLRTYYIEITSIVVFFVFIYLLIFGNSYFYAFSGWLKENAIFSNPDLQNISTIFLGIFIEGLPFILIGVFLSSLIHIFVKEEMIWRLVPKNPWISIPMSAFLGLLLPICECGIVPVARRLIEKGYPFYAAFTFLLAAPIVNPITIVSTYIAFGDQWDMVWLRLGLAIVIAVLMGFLLYLFFSKKDVLKQKKETDHQHVESNHDNQHDHHECNSPNCNHHHHHEKEQGRLSHALYHAVFEFIDMSKYFVLGALIAAGFQTFVGISAIKEVAGEGWMGILLMMGLAFGLSVCSSADAFIAASFRSALSNGPIMSFLVYGPMMDIKNVLMLAGNFRRSVILFLFTGTTLLTALTIWLFL